MAVGEVNLPEMLPVEGFQIGVASAGIKRVGRKDLVLMAVDPGASIAGVFTRNAFCAAPVIVSKQHLYQMDLARPVYLVTNTGNANAGTGERGREDAQATCEALARLADCQAEQVLPFSTGVIGEPLPVGKIIDALPQAFQSLTPSAWPLAAEGIMTTDTRPKGSSRKVALAAGEVVITGISKGAGMIKPNMATMLAYVASDIAVPQEAVEALLGDAVNSSFNRITVDGDTSTNDSAMLVATGKSGVQWSSLGEADKQRFADKLTAVFVDLAQQIIRDGEGATKFVTIQVEGGGTQNESLSVAYTVAESPLVKTALFASDPNWGRILAAIGRAGLVDLDVEGVSVWLDDVLIAENGGRAASYREEAGQKVMDQQDITIRIDLGRGDCAETVWTSDLSHEYVRINAEYRT